MKKNKKKGIVFLNRTLDIFFNLSVLFVILIIVVIIYKITKIVFSYIPNISQVLTDLLSAIITASVTILITLWKLKDKVFIFRRKIK